MGIIADNVAITAGTGTTVAADEVVDGVLGTVKAQYVKLMDGTLDGTTKVPAGAFGLSVACAGQQPATTTGSITTSASSVVCSVTGYGNVTIAVFGTYAGVNAVFEASADGGTNYFGIQVQRELDGAVVTSTGALAANAIAAYSTSAPGFTHVRIRATAWTSGTASVVMAPGGMPFEPVVSISPPRPTVSAPSSVTSTVTADTTILAANSARLGAVIYNDSTAVLTIYLGTGQSATQFTYKLASQQAYEVSFGYVGAISGSWAAANGAARVTELTP